MQRLATLTAVPCLAALVLSAAAIAQQQPQPVTPGRPSLPPQNQPALDANRPPMPVIDVEFPGGEVLAFVQAVQKAAMSSEAKTPVNVMVPAEAGTIILPPISLKRVSAETALETLQYAFGTAGLHQFSSRNMTNSGDEGLTFAIQYAPGRGSPQMQGPQMQGMMPAQPVQSEAYSLRELISVPEGLPAGDDSLRMSADAVLSALKLAAELESVNATTSATQLLYHPDTQLLIARGTPDQHRLTHSILAQLADMLEQRRNQHGDELARAQHAEMQLLELRAQGAGVQAQVQRAETEMGPAVAELDRLEKLFQAGSAGASEVERARANVSIAKANIDAAIAQRELLEERAQLLQRKGGSARAASKNETIVVVYDLRDLSNFKSDFYNLVKTVIKPEGQMSVKAGAGDPTGNVVVHATRAQHEVLVAIFNTARRLKTNEPKLPGTTLDALIEQSKE